ncbi:universal stress protein [Algoriphagus mannitolivorans]|uniref:universal stress protein n=1 Tax=Algoriphagus mannitolivorans TaxID=226504 RepID=UPI00040B3FB7|nr:universal stress protein [Algoriphagus mannitolivorans]
MKVLVPIDFSENSLKALEFAIFYAEKRNGRIILVHVIEIVYDFASQASIAMESMHEEAGESMKQLIKKHQSEGVEIEYRVEEGTASISIARIAEEEEASLIIMGTQGEAGINKVLFGSTAVNVIREANCPVLVVPGEAQINGIKRITLALEFSNHEEKFIDWIVGLSKTWNLSLEILHVQTAQDFRGQLMVMGIESYLEKKHPGIPIRIHTYYAENAAEGLDNYLHEHENLIMVMCHEHKNLWSQVLHKSKSIKMAYHTHVPLLIMN